MDSVPAMISRREMEADYDKETMAEKPRVLSRSIPKLLEPLKEANTALVFINQIRDKLSYGGGTTTPGGKAIPFFATTRLELKRSDILTEKDVAYGQVMTAIVRKNKVGRPYGTIKTDLFFGVGFNYTKEVVIIAKELGIIDGSTWLYLPEANEDGEVIKIQGVDNVVEYYNNNPDKFENLKTKIQQRLDYSLVADTVKAKDIKDEEGY
jgi:recombination protein RecA